MATGPETTRSWENSSTTTALVPPPRLPHPRRSPHESYHNNSTSTTQDSLDTRLSAPEISNTPSILGDERNEHRHGREVTSRNLLKLPLLDTTQSSHCLLSVDQSPPRQYDRYPSKRRRVEQIPSKWANPTQLKADSPPTNEPHGQLASFMSEPQRAGYHHDIPSHALARPQNDVERTTHADQPSRDVACCLPGCRGPICEKLRSIVQDLVTEICTRDPLVSGITSSSDCPPPKPILPNHSEIETADALSWALQRLRWNNASLRSSLTSNAAPRSDHSPSRIRNSSSLSYLPTLERMKRQHDAVDKDAKETLQQTLQPHYHNTVEQPALAGAQSHDTWRQLEAMDPPGQPLFRHDRSASFSHGPPIPSPLQSSQSARMLPSPSSLILPMPPSLSSVSSPFPMPPSSAHLVHLEELQHQVSVKQLALQTLQREHDALIQKLERQRVKSRALERKFEVSDAEINSLTDEKERLAGQVQMLENQVGGLQQARDEARKMSAESASQYMKIVEMAGKLQGKSVEDKKSWETEKNVLLSRISDLEDISRLAMFTGDTGGQKHHGSQESPPPLRTVPASSPPYNLESSTYDGTAPLRHEVMGLCERISALEFALTSALEDGKAVRAVALTLTSVGQKLETSALTALGGNHHVNKEHN